MLRAPQGWAPYTAVEGIRPSIWRHISNLPQQLRIRGELRRVNKKQPDPLRGHVQVQVAILETPELDMLCAVTGSEAEMRALALDLPRQGISAKMWWQDMPLQGPNAPHICWPHPPEVHIVAEGGIDNARGDTGRDFEPLGVFTDLPAADMYARALEEFDRAIWAAYGYSSDDVGTRFTVRTVPLDVVLVS